MKILRDAAKERRKNGEKFSTMAPDEVLKQQLKHLFGGDSDSQGSEPDGGGVLGAPPRAPPPASMPHPGASRQQQQQQRHPRPLSTRVPSADSEPALLPAPPVEPARQLRYVVPAKDAEKENVSTHGGGTGGRDRDKPTGGVSKPRKTAAGKRKDPNQRTLSQAFRGDDGDIPGDIPGEGVDVARRTADARWAAPAPERAHVAAARPPPPKKKKVAAKKAPAATDPKASSAPRVSRPLRFTDRAKDTADPRVLEEFEAMSAIAAACAIGVLLRDTVNGTSFGFRSNLEPEMGGKAGGDDAKRAAKTWLASLPPGHPRRDAGVGGAIERTAVAFGVVFLGGGIPEVPGCDPGGGVCYVFTVDPHGSFASATHAAAITRAITARRQTTADTAGSSQPRPVVVHHAQAVTRELAKAGVIPDVATLEVMDSRCMAWLALPDDSHEGGIAVASSRFPDAAGTRPDGSTGDAPAPPAPDPFERARTGGSGRDGGGDEKRVDALESFRSDLLSSAALAQRLRRAGLNPAVVRTEGKVAAALGQIEHLGLGFDPSVVRAAVGELRGRLSRIERQAAASMPNGKPINLGSPQQVAEALYVTLKLPPPSSNAQQGAKTTQLTTKDDTLRSLRDAHPLPGLVLEHRSVTRAVAMCNSYASLANGKRLRCDWNNTRTATGRLSSSNPNLQAVGKDAGGSEFSLRGAFAAPPGKVLLAADYSQIELRMLAHLSGDTGLISLLRRQITDGGDVFERIWNAGRGTSPETPVSKEDRDSAKRTVYGLLYGQGKTGLAEKLGCTGDVAQGLINAFFRAFPGVRTFVSRTKERARCERMVVLPSGRHRPLPGIRAADQAERAESERKAVNSLIQGSAADLMKIAMCRWLAAASPAGIDPTTSEHRDVASAASNVPVRLVAQIHDELLFECEDSVDAVTTASAVVSACMERAVPALAVPTPSKVCVGKTWATLAPFETWLEERRKCEAGAGRTLGGDPD